MTESLFYIQRIRAQYDTGIFSKSDKRIADYLLEHPGAVDGETASSIAEKVGTSPATVVRFCRKLGFKGLTDMKNSAAYTNYIESSTTDMDLKKGDDAETVANKVVQYMKMVLDQLKLSLEPELLQKAAEKACVAGSTIHHMPFPVTPQMVQEAMLRADEIGKAYKVTGIFESK